MSPLRGSVPWCAGFCYEQDAPTGLMRDSTGFFTIVYWPWKLVMWRAFDSDKQDAPTGLMRDDAGA